MDEITLLENQLKRMRSMNRFYHLQFLNDVRYFFVIGLISIIIALTTNNIFATISVGMSSYLFMSNFMNI